VVVVFPLVPVMSITLYPFVIVDNIFLSKARAILPGKFDPPLNKVVLSFRITFEVIIAISELILIFHTSFIYILKVILKLSLLKVNNLINILTAMQFY